MLREAVVLATLITHPNLIEAQLAVLERLEMSLPDHRAMLAVLLSDEFGDAAAARAAIARKIGPEALENLFALNHVRIAPPILRPEAGDVAAQCLAEELAKLEAGRGVEREVREAAQDIGEETGEGLTWRLAQATEAREKAFRGQQEDRTAYDVADSGALMSREERKKLQSLLGQIEFSKKGRNNR